MPPALIFSRCRAEPPLPPYAIDYAEADTILFFFADGHELPLRWLIHESCCQQLPPAAVRPQPFVSRPEFRHNADQIIDSDRGAMIFR
jgi:hypothetical protein